MFSGAHINLIGVGWGLAAAVCAACYFVMSANVSNGSADSEGVNPITLAAAGLVVGAAAVTLLGVVGIMPLTFTTNDTVIAGWTTSWVVPVVALGVVATAVAYTLGIMGISMLRPRFASLVGLSEVMFAVLAAWVLLGEAMTTIQAVGGAIVLVGLALARQGDRCEELADVTLPDGVPSGISSRCLANARAATVGRGRRLRYGKMAGVTLLRMSSRLAVVVSTVFCAASALVARRRSPSPGLPAWAGTCAWAGYPAPSHQSSCVPRHRGDLRPRNRRHAGARNAGHGVRQRAAPAGRRSHRQLLRGQLSRVV